MPNNYLIFHAAQMGDWEDAYDQYQLSLLESALINSPASNQYQVTFCSCRTFKPVPSRMIYKIDKGNYEHDSMSMLSQNVLLNDLESNDTITYIHLKGVSKPDSWHAKEWREYLLNHFVSKPIQTEADLSGVLFFEDRLTDQQFTGGKPKKYFAGNHWTAKVSYLRTLEPYDSYLARYKEHVEKHGGEHRFAAEMWVGSGITEDTKLNVMDNTHFIHDRGNAGIPNLIRHIKTKWHE